MKCVLIWDGQEGKSLPERSILEAAGPGRVARVGWGSSGLSPDLEEGFSVPRGRRGPPGGTGRALGVCTPFQGVRASDRAVGLWGATACPAMPGEAAPSALKPSPSWNAGALVRPLSHSSSPQSGLGSREYPGCREADCQHLHTSTKVWARDLSPCQNEKELDPGARP